MNSRGLWLSLLACPAWVLAQQGTQGPPIVEKFFKGLSHAKYTATRITENRLGGKWIQNSERVTVNGTNVRIDFATGSHNANESILDVGGKRYHYFFSRNEAEVSRARGEELVGRLKRAYKSNGVSNVSTQNGGLVAGRSTEVVTVTNRDGKPVIRAWIDSEHGVILKREAYDRQGEKVSAMEVQQVNFDPHFSGKEFQIDNRNIRMVTPLDQLQRLCQKEHFPLVLIKEPGLELDVARSVMLGPQKGLMELWSGKDTRVSLFVVNGDLPQEPEGAGRVRGGVHRYIWKRGAMSLGLIGELSDERLKDLASKVIGP